ncbi:MAG: SH3 domain-containing protein [Candidatus Aminicenantes bacterium]|nr:SH3 domain-containing protein [Candidatus Aminicenantes bacterium]
MKRINQKIHLISLVFFIQFLFFGPVYSITQKETPRLKVVTELANIRAEPDISSPIIHLADQGTLMDILGQDGPWYHVQITINDEKTIQGYVHESLVETIQPQIPEPEQKITPEPEQEIKEIPLKKEKAKTPETETQKVKDTELFFPKISQIYIQVSGGGNYSLVGDLNDGAKGFSDYHQNLLSAEKSGEVMPLHLTYIYGGEVGVHLGLGLHLGIGADYFRGQKESSVYFSLPSPFNIQTKPEIEVIPIRLVLSYHFIPEFYIKAGVEYILAECGYFYRITEADVWQEWRGKADSNQLGGVLTLGFVHDFSQNISLFFEATGRYTKIKNLKGEHTFRDSTGFEYKEQGSMYIYQGEVLNQGSYPLLFISNKPPSGYGVSFPEKATLDISGLAVQAGLRIRFSLFN